MIEREKLLIEYNTKHKTQNTNNIFVKSITLSPHYTPPLIFFLPVYAFLTLSLSLTSPLINSFNVPLSLTYTHTLCISFYYSLTCRHTYSLYLFLSLSHLQTHILYVSLSITLSLADTHTLCISFYHSRTCRPSFSCSHYFSLSSYFLSLADTFPQNASWAVSQCNFLFPSRLTPRPFYCPISRTE